jgi:peptide/nickel transport system substrate-binding protein
MVTKSAGVRALVLTAVLMGGVVALVGCGSTTVSAASSSVVSATTATASTIITPNEFAIDQTWDPFAGLTIMNPNSSTNAIMQWVLEPLAIQSGRVTNGPYYPEVAKRWSMKDGTLTIWLRHNEGWSNGKPVTAQDVKVSLELDWINAGTVAPYIKTIDVVNKYEIKVSENKPYALFEPEILNGEVYPASEYGPLIPKDIESLYFTSLKNTSAGTKAGQKIALLTKKVEAYKRNYFLGNGPYEISGVTSGELTLKVNPYYWNAKNIHVPDVLIYNVQGNNQAWGDYLGNKVDFGQYIVNKQILHEWLDHPGHKYNAPLGNSTSNLVFDTTTYPFNMVQVRQALAYLVNRKEITADAEPVMGYPIKVPTGFSVAVTQGDLTASQRNQLNTYPYDPTKAAKLLRSVGFKKTSRGWVMPNGKLFSSGIYIYSGATDWALAAEQMAKSFTNFGLATNVHVINQDTYWNDYDESPGYPMYMDYGGGTSYALLQMENVISWWSYVETPKGTTSHASGYTTLGDAEDVKLGSGSSVNLPAETWQLVTSGPSQTDQLVWKLSQALNADMVTLPIWDGINGSLYSTQYFTGWPAANSPAWVLWSQNGSNAAQNTAAFFISQGWLRPVK